MLSSAAMELKARLTASMRAFFRGVIASLSVMDVRIRPSSARIVPFVIGAFFISVSAHFCSTNTSRMASKIRVSAWSSGSGWSCSRRTHSQSSPCGRPRPTSDG